MINNRFEVYKVKRELKRSGKEYKFMRPMENEYKEPSDDSTEVGTLLGLYHERNGYIAVSVSDVTQVRTKGTPSILCLYDDVAPLGLVIGDMVVINGKTMIVNGIVNIQEWNMIADISLEVVDDGH